MAKSKPIVSKASSSGGGLAPWLGIATIVILLDQITKITVNKTFRYGEDLFVTSFFNLTLAYNKGAAFSFLGNAGGWQRYLFTGIGHFPAVNVADTAICIGAGLMILDELRRVNK